MAARCRVLLVDPDSRTARVLARMLREDGFDVEIATGAAGAMGRLSRSPPDVLLTDMELPQADRLAIVHYARMHSPALPVFVFTGYPDLARSVHKALDPAPRVFAKPVDYGELTRELEAAVGACGATGPEQPSSKRG